MKKLLLFTATILWANWMFGDVNSFKRVPPERKLDIQKMIDNTANGKVLTIPYGTYIIKKSFVISGKKNVTITSQPGTRILVDNTELDVLMIKGCEEIKVKNLYLRHVVPLGEYECHGGVVDINYSKNIEIDNCEINGCGARGVTARKSQKITVKNCFIHHNTFLALGFYNCDDILIKNNRIEDNGNLMGSSSDEYTSTELEFRDNLIQRNGGYWEKTVGKPGLKNKEVTAAHIQEAEKASKAEKENATKKVSKATKAALVNANKVTNQTYSDDSAPYKEIWVSNAAELIDAIGSNRTIRLKPGEYLLSKVAGRVASKHVLWTNETDGKGIVLRKLKNFKICGMAGAMAKTRILMTPRHADVLRFVDSNDIILENVTLGHYPEEGYCEGGVVSAKDTKRLKIKGCDLFGCGTEGLTFDKVTGFNFDSSRIRDCSYGIMTLSSSKGLHFSKSKFIRNREFNGASLTKCSDVRFSDCLFADNEMSTLFCKSVIETNECKDIQVKDCVFKDNAMPPVEAKDSKILVNCKIDLRDSEDSYPNADNPYGEFNAPKHVKAFKFAFESGYKSRIAKFMKYPIRNYYPLPDIKNEKEFVEVFDSIFDKQVSDAIHNLSLKDGWETIGWRGVLLTSKPLGQFMWLYNDGKVRAIMHDTDQEKNIHKLAVKEERKSLHKSLRNFGSTYFNYRSELHHVRIDSMPDGKLRCAIWFKDRLSSEKPDLIMNDGDHRSVGSAGNDVYTFKHGDFAYQVTCGVAGKYEADLTIYKNGKEVSLEELPDRVTLKGSFSDYYRKFKKLKK